MEEKTIVTIAVLMAVSGIICLALFSQNAQQEKQKLTGTIGKIVKSEKVTIAYAQVLLPIVFFEQKNFTKGEDIIVYGQLQNYQGKIEFVAD